jgi:tripartite-type tricarboxylate transporter receptor subunit TctC
MKRIVSTLIFVAIASISAGSAHGGGTVTLKIGSNVGAAYDTIGRLVGRHLGKFLPGNPEVIVENVVGGGGLMLSREIESSAPADGSVIGLPNSGLITTSILTPDRTPFHADKVRWVGSMGLVPSVCVMTTKSGVNRVADLLSHPGTKFGATGNGTKLYVQPAMLKHLYGADLQVVQGFNSISEIRLAMERGEIDGLCGVSLNTFSTTGFADFSKPIGTFIEGTTYKGVALPPLLPPDITDADRQAAALWYSDEQVFGPFMVPGATDPSIVEAIGKALTDMEADPEFLADAEQVYPGMKPTTGEAVEALVAKLVATDKAIIDRARQLAE